MLTGVLLVDKPGGLTSHDVVDRVRRLARERRCGHTGTLDPLATGLLILLFGRATRLARFLTTRAKTYRATVRFGYATDTYDRTGEPAGPKRELSPSEASLRAVLESFRGRQRQHPPAYSAKKLGGQRAYRLARAGVTVTPSPVEVEIHSLRLVSLDGPLADLELTVSSGTYIRSLAHELGQRLGSGAHLEALRRTRIGSFRVEEAFRLSELEREAQRGELGELILSADEALRDLVSVTVGADAARRLVHGQRISWAELQAAGSMHLAPSVVRVLGPNGELLAVAEPDEERRELRSLLVWARPEEEVPKGPHASEARGD